MKAPLYVYISVMWVMIVVGGGILVAILGPLKIDGFGRYGDLVDSAVKAVIAILLVVIWIFVMSKIKNWIFHRRIKN